jgi:hypothetical protein
VLIVVHPNRRVHYTCQAASSLYFGFSSANSTSYADNLDIALGALFEQLYCIFYIIWQQQ